MAKNPLIYRAVLVQVLDWARRCASLVRFKRAWEKGSVPPEEMGARAISLEDDQKLEQEVFHPSLPAASTTPFDPKSIEIHVYGGKEPKAKKAATPVIPEIPVETAAARITETVFVAEAPEAVMPEIREAEEVEELEAPLPRVSLKPTLLVIDDYEPLLKMMSNALRNQGYEVRTARDGVEGLVRMHENNIDLIISDVQMPKLDGFDLSRMLNVRESTRDIPIVFLTEVLDEKTKAVAKRLGAADTLVKPFTLDTLFESVKSILLTHPNVTMPTPVAKPAVMAEGETQGELAAVTAEG